MTNETVVPRFGRGVQFRFDAVRGQWMLLAPEKLFQPDEIMTEILKLIDGERTIASIVNDLVARFAAPRDVIARDVRIALEDLAGRGAIRL
jgi:pyrroloquinoline quinone biosynthesis protein D